MRELSTDEVGGEEMKKNTFCNLKKINYLQFFFGCSFGFAFER
jgi:hypothetical protein